MSEDIRVKDGIMNHLNGTWADTKENKMKQDLIIIGYGHVGKAIDKALNPIHRIVAIDIDGYQKNTITKHEGYSAKGIIICVPTPEAEDGSCDISIVEKVLQESNKLNLPVLIKSTISIDGYAKLTGKYRITYSPEFLRQRYADDDMKNVKDMFIGGADVPFWVDVLREVYPMSVKIHECSVPEMILTKYIRNSYLATKVVFFNEIANLCKKLDVDYKKVVSMVEKDDRVGSSHMKVPGDHGKGYAGACFPKDVRAFLKTAELASTRLSVLKTVDKTNRQIRGD
jgi:UDPglucose 6-dehydrogenase